MGYHMRFIVKDDKELSFEKLESALKELDSKYSVDFDKNEGELIYGDSKYAVLEINKKDDEYFEDDIEMLIERVEVTEGENKEIVLDTLRNSKSFFFVRVLLGGRDDEETLGKIDPIWEWLFENYEGLMQADLEGYYDSSGLIFEIE